MDIHFQIENNKLIDVSDIKNENHNIIKNIENADELYKYISGYDYDESIVEDFVENIFNHEDDSGNLSSYKIKHWVSNRSYGELIDMYNNNEIIVPNMQRNFVWDSIKCSRLIESIILGLPIPPLFLLEISDNKYELIDGFQRLTTLANYVGGRQWNYDEEVNTKIIPARLSSKIAHEIASKTYDNLEAEYQMKLKRSTIPLIEFKQLNPENYDSKYLIFERINTGSVKLNSMQIRKSLSYGTFIESLYEGVNNINLLKNIFSATSLKKDNHVEAVLRSICFSSYIYTGDFKPISKGIKNILNEYCEYRKNQELTKEEFMLIENGLSLLTETFNKEELFKRVEITEHGDEIFTGNVNISIFESLLGAVMKGINNGNEINKDLLYTNYRKEMIKVSKNQDKSNSNPFSISTGTFESIQKRFIICNQIIKDSLT